MLQFIELRRPRYAEMRTAITQGLIRYRSVAVQLLLLLLALFINKKLDDFKPRRWILVPIFLAVLLARTRFGEAEKPLIRLWQLIGLIAAFYSLLHYPLMPPANGRGMQLYALVLFGWVMSVVAGGLCFRVPSLSVFPPGFLIWCNAMAVTVTGLPTTTTLDIQPLPEVSVCIGLGLMIERFHHWRRTRNAGRPDMDDACPSTAFANLVFMMAISILLANYFWSFCAKMSLNGPFAAWLTQNNPAYLFLVALDDGHIFFSGYPRLVEWAFDTFNRVHLYSDFWVLVCELTTIGAFFMPRWAFLTLLLMLNAMHASIIVIAGANFWPWILLNIAIAAVVFKQDLRVQPLTSRLIATAFIVIAPHFAHVAPLGWYDTGANNKLYFEAVDESGRRYAVPSNFFTFYSYSFGHMDYGTPDPETAFAVISPNGGAWDFQLFQAGRSCNVAALVRPGAKHWFDRDKLPAFIRNYHRLVLTIYSKAGIFPYDFYPHHFYVPVSQSTEFAALDKRRIVAYIYKRESVCLSFEKGALQRKVIATAEYRINLNGNHD
jgi:hypothetical protein